MGRNPCCPKEGLNRGAWSSEEDEILTAYVNLHGEGKWRTVVKNAGLKRCAKSCRLRWLNYLKPGVKRGNISRDEEDLIIRLHCLLGNRWALIAGRLPGRTDNEIKNYWNTILVKKLQKRSIRSNYPRQLLPFKSQVPFEDHEAMELESFHIPESNQLVNPNRCSLNVSPFHSKPADKCDDAGDSLGFFIDAVAGGSEISGHKLLEDVNDLLLVSSSSPSGSLISRDEGKVIESDVKNNGHGPILAMELKKLASFLDLEDEWREIQLDQDSTI